MARTYPPEWRAHAAVPALLEPGERLIWQGQPARRSGIMPPEGRPGILASGGAFILFMLWALTDRGDQGHFSANLIGAAIVSLLVGVLLFTSSIPIYAYRRHHRYVVTDRRVLLLEQRRHVHVEAYTPDQITFVTVHDRGDGRADVFFREGPWLRRFPNAVAEGPQNPIGFLAIRDAEAAVAALTWLRARRPVAPSAHPWDASRDDPTDPERAS